MEPSEEIDLDLERLAALRRTVAGCYLGARRAVRMARRYRREEGRPGTREAACLAQARVWRDEARALRAAERRPEAIPRPGVARAGARPLADTGVKKSG